MIKLVWATPDIDQQIAYIARVSNPQNQDNPNIEKLLGYMMQHGHVSPFEMASVCIEINTTRDIGRQILRHRSFSFQEFSGRYQSFDKLAAPQLRECRLQDTQNRQNSLECEDANKQSIWADIQNQVVTQSISFYEYALSQGIAKEVARSILPEGLTASKLYMAGTMRSWIHYLKQRLDKSTQKEHRLIAEQISELLHSIAPITMKATNGIR
tara:strand:- start:84 stop:719 length:636 start_codon:yes stop_codon:yes gene_type:complete